MRWTIAHFSSNSATYNTIPSFIANLYQPSYETRPAPHHRRFPLPLTLSALRIFLCGSVVKAF